MNNPFMLRSTAEKENAQLKQRVHDQGLVIQAQGKLLRKLGEDHQRLVSREKALLKASAQAAIADEVPKVLAGPPTLDDQLRDLDAAIKVTAESKPIRMADRSHKRRDLDKLYKERENLLMKIRDAGTPQPVADIQAASA